MADPYLANVSLLLPFTGANNSTTFIDYSPNPKTISVIDGAKITTAVNDPWGNNVGVGTFDGAADGLTFPNGADFDFGSGALTIEFWGYREGVNSNYSRIYNPDGDYYNGTALVVDPSGYLMTFGTANDGGWNLWSAPYSPLMPLSSWHYYALVRDGDVVTLYEGSTPGSATSSHAIVTLSAGQTLFQTAQSLLCIGGQHGVDRSFFGKFSNYRITKGIARDCSTVPVAAFPLDSNLTIPITGQSISNYINTVVSNCNKEIPSLNVTLSIGNISGESSFNVVGQNITNAQGQLNIFFDILSESQNINSLLTNILPEITILEDSQSLLNSLGSISISVGNDITLSLTGQNIVSNQNSISFCIKCAVYHSCIKLYIKTFLSVCSYLFCFLIKNHKATIS